MLYTKKVIRKIRQQLPHVYADELAKRVDGYTSTDVIKIFNGQLKNEKKVGEILDEALKWIEERKQEALLAEQTVNELSKSSK